MISADSTNCYWKILKKKTPESPLKQRLNLPCISNYLYSMHTVFTSIVHCWWEGKLVKPLQKIVWSFLKKLKIETPSVQFSSVAQLCPTLCDPMNCSTPGLPVHHQLPEFTQTHVHRVTDAIQPSHLLSSPSPPAPNPSQHQSLFQWVNSSNEVAKVLEFQL